jgi:hypothetical protein
MWGRQGSEYPSQHRTNKKVPFKVLHYTESLYPKRRTPMTLSAVPVRHSRRLVCEDAITRRSSHRANKGVFKDKFTIDHTASLHKRKRVRKRKNGADGTPRTITSSMQNPTVKAEADDDPNWKRIVQVRRKVANRTRPFDMAEEELNLVSSSSQAADILPDLVSSLSQATDTLRPNAGATWATARWTSEEDAKLTSAVANTHKKKIGKEYKRDWVAVAALVPGRTRNQCWSRWNDALDPNVDRTKGREGEWTSVENSKLKDAVQMHGGKNWEKIAALVPGRTKIQCNGRWNNFLKSSNDQASARKGSWTAVEDIKLKNAVQTHGGNDWVVISALVPGRTRIQCSERWHGVLKHSIDGTNGRTGKWSEDEDSKLKDAVQMHGGKNWFAISALVPGRTKIQCRNRWHNALDPSIGRANGREGKWAEDEDNELRDAVQRHGSKDWSAIAALVPGRTKGQCNQRWRDVLDPSIDQASVNRRKWTAVEDSKLKDAVQTHGGKNWGAISALVSGRTQKQCRNRWKDVLDPTRL